MEKVSVIIPVYNVENYIRECIISIVEQTYKNIEIILIDDGSTDLSSKICDEYAQNDNRIIVIHQENLGVSIARNRGISSSKGKYIMFIDSDDFVKKDYIEKMVNNIKESDMCVCGYIEHYLKKDINLNFSIEKENIDKIKCIDSIFNNRAFGGYLWNKVFKADIIKKNNLAFDCNIHMCEDVLFVIKYLICCENINIIPDYLYYYRMRKNSMVWSKNDSKYESLFLAYKQVLRILNDYKIDDKNCKIDILLFALNNNLKLEKLKLMIDFDFEMEFKKFIRMDSINNKVKLKLFISKYFKIVYKIYVYLKKNIYKQYS